MINLIRTIFLSTFAFVASQPTLAMDFGGPGGPDEDNGIGWHKTVDTLTPHFPANVYDNSCPDNGQAVALARSNVARTWGTAYGHESGFFCDLRAVNAARATQKEKWVFTPGPNLTRGFAKVSASASGRADASAHGILGASAAAVAGGYARVKCNIAATLAMNLVAFASDGGAVLANQTWSVPLGGSLPLTTNVGNVAGNIALPGLSIINAQGWTSSGAAPVRVNVLTVDRYTGMIDEVFIDGTGASATYEANLWADISLTSAP